MARTTALCIFSNLLGNVSMTRLLVNALNHVPDLDPAYLIVEPEDYRRYPAPWWARLSDPWQAQFLARRKAAAELKKQYDFLWVYGWEMAVGFRNLARRVPAAVTLDTVPLTMDRQLRQRGLGGWKRTAAHQIHHRALRAAAPAYRVWLPMTSDCAQSLQEDYGVQPGRCRVTLNPQDVDWWTPPPRRLAPPWRLLFVGNDFQRKGGDRLMRLCSHHFSGGCTWTIVSNDPSFADRRLPPGVRWVRGATREQVRQCYWESHLFVFPTMQDFAPQVLAEAASAGLPVLATNLGGIGNLVRHGATGWLLPQGASDEQWAEALRNMLSDPQRLRRMSLQARQFAEDWLDVRRFERLVAEVVALLREPMQP